MHLCILFSLIFFIVVVYLSTGTGSAETLQSHEQLELETSCSYSEVKPGDVRIMTFNLWYGGDKVVDGINKIAKHINLLEPDAVCLQVVALLVFFYLFYLGSNKQSQVRRNFGCVRLSMAW